MGKLTVIRNDKHTRGVHIQSSYCKQTKIQIIFWKQFKNGGVSSVLCGTHVSFRLVQKNIHIFRIYYLFSIQTQNIVIGYFYIGELCNGTVYCNSSVSRCAGTVFSGHKPHSGNYFINSFIINFRHYLITVL